MIHFAASHAILIWQMKPFCVALASLDLYTYLISHIIHTYLRVRSAEQFWNQSLVNFEALSHYCPFYK